MTQDGIQYLDLGDALQRGFTTGVSTYWSLLYPWLVGLVLHTFHPPPSLEFPVVHALNFLIFVAALGAFQFLLSGLLTKRPSDRLFDCALMGIGYTAFLYTTLDFADLGLVTPDLLVAALLYLVPDF